MTSSPLLLLVMAALGRLQVKERFIHSDKDDEVVEGQHWDDGVIEINPVPAVVRTILHECLHEVKPELSETAIKAHTTRLWNSLTEDQMKAIYEVYKEKLEEE